MFQHHFSFKYYCSCDKQKSFVTNFKDGFTVLTPTAAMSLQTQVTSTTITASATPTSIAVNSCKLNTCLVCWVVFQFLEFLGVTTIYNKCPLLHKATFSHNSNEEYIQLQCAHLSYRHLFFRSGKQTTPNIFLSAACEQLCRLRYIAVGFVCRRQVEKTQ